MGIFATGLTHAVRADRIGGITKQPVDGHFRRYTYHWECIACEDSFFVGRLFRRDDLEPECWPSGTTFRSTRTNEKVMIIYSEQLALPEFDEVNDEG